MHAALLLVALAASAALVVAGVSKIVTPRSLSTTVGTILRIPRIPAIAIAVGFGAIELFVGITLTSNWLSGAWRTAAIVAVFGIGSAISGISIIAIRSYAELTCGCFGSATQEPFGIRNVLYGMSLVILAIALTVVSGESIPIEYPPAQVLLIFVIALALVISQHAKSFTKIMASSFSWI